MIDKNRPLLANQTSTDKWQDGRLQPACRSHRLPRLGQVSVLASGIVLATLALTCFIATLLPKNWTPNSSASDDRKVRADHVQLQRPTFEDPLVILQQLEQQLLRGPAVQADVHMTVRMPDTPTADGVLNLHGVFMNLGQGSGMAKTGIYQQPGKDPIESTDAAMSDRQIFWVVNRSQTCIQTQTGPQTNSQASSDSVQNRFVFQQPEWWNQKPTGGDCYGSPASLLQWAGRQFVVTSVQQRNEQQVQIQLQLRSTVAQSWADGTKLDPTRLQQPTAPGPWMAEHVLHPIPHQLQLTISLQPLTLLTARFLRFQPGQDSPETFMQCDWDQWRLAPQLGPQDFPIQLESDLPDWTAQTGSQGNITR